MRRGTRRWLTVPMLLIATAGANVACSSGPAAGPPDLATLRLQETSQDPDGLALLLLHELAAAGGDAVRAKKVRLALDSHKTTSLLPSFARALDDKAHGDLASAADHFMEAVAASRESTDARTQLIAWYSASQALALANSHAGLWKKWQGFVEATLDQPGAIGWRARGALLRFWNSEQKASPAQAAA